MTPCCRSRWSRVGRFLSLRYYLFSHQSDELTPSTRPAGQRFRRNEEILGPGRHKGLKKKIENIYFILTRFQGLALLWLFRKTI